MVAALKLHVHVLCSCRGSLLAGIYHLIGSIGGPDHDEAPAPNPAGLRVCHALTESNCLHVFQHQFGIVWQL